MGASRQRARDRAKICLPPLGICMVAILVAGCGSPKPVAGQDDPDVLAGWESIDARVSLTWDTGIEGYDESTVESLLEGVFQAELGSAGIPVTTEPQNFLWFELNAMAPQAGARVS